MHFLTLAEALPIFFTAKDIRRILKIQLNSARVLATRYTQKGIFLRIKRDLYIFQKKFLHLTRDEIYELNQALQAKSYISFSTALAHHHTLAPSVAKNPWVEAVSPLRSWEKTVGHLTWHYYKLPYKFFFGFVEHGNALLATPEKALLDALYLHSLGRYYLDLKKLNLERLDQEKLFNWARFYTPKTQVFLERLYSRSRGK
ncbi:hypothetical protein IPG41_04540 [Candidatus Peregrinibacteria bacterium]|nr:MAG: hypothetical protein IPG41_04540 [Candidatus Peregrinibacteria bacterium]